MIKVAPLRPEGSGAWDAFVAGHPHGTFFHRAAWSELLGRVFGHSPYDLVATQDGAVAGVLPLVRVKTMLFGDSLMSSPFAVYGGPLAADDAAATALEEAAEELMRRLGVPVMEWRFRDTPPALGSGWQAKDDLYVTFRKPITANDDVNLKAIPRKQRAMVRKGIERGLVSTAAGGAGAEVDTLHRVYAESVRNLGTPVFPKRWFRALAETFAAEMDVIVVRHGEQAVSAVMNFYDRGEVLPYYGGGTMAARDLAAHDFLYWEVMRRAAAKGCTGFDFGRSKAGTGSFAFKKNWGFTPAPLLHRFRLAPGRTIPDHNPLNPKYRLMIAAWKRLPLPVANVLGPYIVRGVG